ncbi:MAG: TonB-dependent receptor [Weeksellaceae bacterium]|nr:TonB-dependent receptor [Weeksellaceae bacterium]
MIKKLTFYLLLLLTIQIYAQHSISGSVYDNNNQIVEASGIQLLRDETSKFTKSGKDGKYKFTDVANGEYSLKVTVGDREEVFFITVDNNDLVYDVELSAAENIKLKTVEIRKNKSLKKEIENKGFAANVIETKEASKRNIQTNELLDRTVGVRVRQSGGVGSSVEYNLNGMSGRSVGVFLDGIDVSTYGSSFNLNNIPPAMIERIEVYKGVLPAHLSGDYLGGAINIILKEGISQNSLSAAISYGSFNTFQTDINGMYRNKSNGFTTRVSAFYTYSDNDYEIFGKFAHITEQDGSTTYGKYKRFNDAYKTYGGRIEAGFTNVKWADSFFIGLNSTHAYKEIQHGLYMTRPYKGRFTESDANVFSLVYKKKDFLIKNLDLNFTGNYSDRDQYIQDTVTWSYNWDGNIQLDVNGNPMRRRDGGAQQGKPQMLTVNRKIYTFRAGLNYNISDQHRISFNHNFYTLDRHDDDKMKHVLESRMESNSDLTKHVSALNYEAEWFTKRLRTNVFGKFYHQQTNTYRPKLVNDVFSIDYLQNNKEVFGYGLATSYALSKKFNILFSAERAVRMPDAREIFGDEADNVAANLGINPEVSHNFNLGFRTSNYKFGNHELALSANGFLRNVKDRIVQRAERTTSNQSAEVQPFENLTKARSIGYEAELNYIYQKNLNIVLNFSKFNSLFMDKNSQYYKSQVPNEPFFTFNGNVQYRLKDLLQNQSVLNVYYSFNYVDSFNTVWYKNNYFWTPVQFSQNIGLSYRFPNKNFIVSFDAKNIFNAEVYDNYAAQKPGRAFYLKLNYTINKL